MLSEKYVLCRPVGGFNDSLNQIEVCWRYCSATGRKMILDSMYSGLLDQWDRYFSVVPSMRDRLLIYRPEMLGVLAQMSCFPKCVEARLDSYRIHNDSSRGCMEEGSGELLSFDKQVDYPHQLLVHHQFGGGQLSFNSLPYFQLIPPIARIVTSFCSLYPPYVSVHVRNTDYQTDYIELLEIVFTQEPERAVLLCSDDKACKEYAKQKFGARFLSASETPDTGGVSLHANRSLNRVRENTNMLVDICMLAFGERFYCSKTKQGLYSGFSVLAHFLHTNRPILNHVVRL